MSTLLSIVELGEYPDFNQLYRESGCEVEVLTSTRKAINHLKRYPVDIIVAEFNYQSDFRDRTSALESLLAILQHNPETKAIIFVHREDIDIFNTLIHRFPVFETLFYPIDKVALRLAIGRATDAVL